MCCEQPSLGIVPCLHRNWRFYGISSFVVLCISADFSDYRVRYHRIIVHYMILNNYHTFTPARSCISYQQATVPHTYTIRSGRWITSVNFTRERFLTEMRNSDNVLITAVKKSGVHWKWPTKQNQLYYSKDETVRVRNTPEEISTPIFFTHLSDCLSRTHARTQILMRIQQNEEILFTSKCTLVYCLFLLETSIKTYCLLVL